MKKFLLSLLLFCAPVCFGQSTNFLSHISLTGSAVGFMGAGSASAATIAGANFQLTKSATIGYEQVIVPSVASFDLGTVTYTKPLSSLLGKTASSKLTFDASKVNVVFMGGVGKLLQSGSTPSRIAESAGVFVAIPVTSSVSYQLVGVQYLHGGVQNGLITSPSTQAISTGLQISF